ncbi:hypothetical protein ACFVZJ_19050 [Streptomyces sp. NPDC058322]
MQAPVSSMPQEQQGRRAMVVDDLVQGRETDMIGTSADAQVPVCSA